MSDGPDQPGAHRGDTPARRAAGRRRVPNAATGVVDAVVTSAGGERLDARLVKPKPPEEPVVAGLPLSLLRRYAEAAARQNAVREVEPGVWIARAVGLEGAWCDGVTADEARLRLPGVVVEWVKLKLQLGARDIPQVEDISLTTH